MRAYRRFSSVQQMGAGIVAFLMLSLVLESGGLVDWAQRLDLGPERTVAVPIAETLHRGLAWTRLDYVRRRELVTLARVGWSDDPAALAEARPAKSAPTVRVRPLEVAAEKIPAPAAMLKEPAAAGPKPSGSKPVANPIPAPTPLAGDPPLLSSLPEIVPVEAGKQRTVALAGDSMMAVGLSSALLREAPRYKDITLVKAFKSGTGLARPEVFDWQTEYPAMLNDAHPDVVVVAIGANDGQGFVQDRVVYPFGTDGWQAIYQQRVQAYLDLLEADGATVVWLGLPPMKSDVYDARIALVNRIDYAIISASPRAIWFSMAGIVGDASGRFQDFAQVGGHAVRMRQGDGIHLSDDGAALVAAKLLPWLAVQEPAPPAAPGQTANPNP
jgi:hypothetical protein